MHEAGYAQIAHDSGLDFFEHNVIPYLEHTPLQSQPGRWRSFMTDDFSPFEYSWSWEKSPRIRYSFEPIGAEAGTAADFFNRKRPLGCAQKLQLAVPESDWRQFNFFADTFYGSEAVMNRRPESDRGSSSPSSIFFAVELGRSETLIKAYLIPVVAEQTQQPRLSVLSKSLEKCSTDVSAYLLLEQHIVQRQACDPIHIAGIAVDCIDPSAARLKIYLRSKETSFTEVCSLLTLDQKIQTWTSEAIADLWKLWKLVLDLPPEHSMDDPLEQVNHETSGVLYHFDIRPGRAWPESKVYIPVKHYGRNDRKIAESLVAFLSEHEQGEYTEKFLKAIERLCSYRRLEDDRGMQTYISCDVKSGGRLGITSYISPELNHPGRRKTGL